MPDLLWRALFGGVCGSIFLFIHSTNFILTTATSLQKIRAPFMTQNRAPLAKRRDMVKDE